MSYITPQLSSLPDELVLVILKQLNNIDVLYSLMGLDQHLDEIIRDPCFTSVVNLMKSNNINSDQNETFLVRFCSDILPKIHHLIKRLQLDLTMMERILLAADYPNLSHLDIFIPHEDPVLNFYGEPGLALHLSEFLDRFHIFVRS